MHAKSLLVTCAALLAAALLLPSSASGAGSAYVDKQYGFSVKVGPEWSQTPTQPGEKIEVAKWKDNQKGDFATLTICRFAKAGEATPGGDGDLPEVPEGWGPPQPKSAMEYLKYEVQSRAQQLIARGLKDEVVPEIPKPKTLKMGKAEGQIYTVDWKCRARAEYSLSWSAGIVGNDFEEYLILYASPLNRAKKLGPYFLSSIRSFRLKGDDTPEADDDDPEKRGRMTCKPDELLDIPKRERIKKELVGTWRFIDTPRYIVIYNCDDGLARYIADRCEYMRTNAYEKVFPPVAPIEECMVVRVCKEMDEYHHYGGPGGSAGYWSSGTDELVFPDLSQSSKPDIQTIGVMHHEGFHQYIHYALLKNHPPIWFNEGFAEYFFCVDFKSKATKLIFEKRHPMRYSTVKSAAGSGGFVPLKDFINMSQGDYYMNAQLCYSQGWAFATWLKNVTKNARYQQIPVILFQEMQKAFAAGQQPDDDGGGGGRPGLPGLPGGPPPGGRSGNGGNGGSDDGGGNDGDDPKLPPLPQGQPQGFPRSWLNGEKVIEDAMQKAFEGIDLDQLMKEFVEDVQKKM